MLRSFFTERGGEGWPAPASLRLVRPTQQQARGQALVEMALVIGIVLLVILGGIDALQILTTQYTVSQAVRASAHQAALVGGPDGQNGSWGADVGHPTGTVAETARVILDSGMLTNASKATITVSCATKPCRRYSAITVRITYQDDLWASLGPFQIVQADLRATRAAEKDQQ